MITHYTRTVEAVANILTHGFAWFPNRRRLTQLLIPNHDYSAREPQQFGMISFTEIEPSSAKTHTEKFGDFGIVISEKWAVQHCAQRVIYVESEGPVTEAWRSLFAIGYNDVQSRITYRNDGVWLMAYENKAVASSIVGSMLWANLLQIWEYMEPASEAQQREWRIVNPKPFYSLSESKSEAISHVSPPQNWAKFTNVIPISRDEIKALICARNRLSELKAVLPSNYQNIPILQIDF
jgi:Putative abortive phage resistance protein AbiGi, antitoxin